MSEQNNIGNNKRIAKNTILLYIRMFFIMSTQLFTSRVVLNTLGIEDYGIYNVVGGVIAMFGFLNGAMSLATQRYLTFELGKKNMDGQICVFNTSLQIHSIISAIVFILAETIGIWFLNNKMIISPERMDAAIWVFQCATLSSIVLVMSVPFNASIIAHEKMSAFAYISVIEVILKLAIVYLLIAFDIDKLKLYSCLILAVQLFIISIYNRYCVKHFEECTYRRIFKKKLFKEMLGFAGWNVIGNCAYLFFTQGLNLLLNTFFGPVVNAARAVAVQVETAIQQFSNNFQMAINPQITKTYAQGNLKAMHGLIYRSCRFTFILLLIISLPVMIEAPIILELWLKQVPDHTVTFFIIIMCTAMIDSTSRPLGIAAAATGNIKKYQIVVGGLLLLILPLSYFVLLMGAPAEFVFIVHFFICSLTFFVRLLILKPMIKLSINEYFKKVIVRLIIVFVISLLLSIGVKMLMPKSIIYSFIVTFISGIITFISCYFIGIDSDEKAFVRNKISLALNRVKH